MIRAIAGSPRHLRLIVLIIAIAGANGCVRIWNPAFSVPDGRRNDGGATFLVRTWQESSVVSYWSDDHRERDEHFYELSVALPQDGSGPRVEGAREIKERWPYRGPEWWEREKVSIPENPFAHTTVDDTLVQSDGSKHQLCRDDGTNDPSALHWIVLENGVRILDRLATPTYRDKPDARNFEPVFGWLDPKRRAILYDSAERRGDDCRIPILIWNYAAGRSETQKLYIDALKRYSNHFVPKARVGEVGRDGAD